MRPRKKRYINSRINDHFFKPRGVRMTELEIIELNAEEVEAIRLKNIENLDQTEAAKKMRTSQSTYQRILSSAYKKMSDAIINGKAIKVSDQ